MGMAGDSHNSNLPARKQRPRCPDIRAADVVELIHEEHFPFSLFQLFEFAVPKH
jgi:hypothetical protein